MEVGIDLSRPLHTNGGGQHRVHASYPRFQTAFRRSVDVHDLFERVYPGICPAGTDGGDGMIEETGERRFKTILNGPTARLRLPPVPGGAVVGQAQCYARHGLE